MGRQNREQDVRDQDSDRRINYAFQFNHIRYYRDYEALLCVGIGPAEIKFDAWSKADVVTGKAGRPVTMDKGSSATHKLTKRRDQLTPIEQFEDKILELLSDF